MNTINRIIDQFPDFYHSILSHFLKKNNDKILKYILDKINSPPSLTDTSGYVYVFYLPSEPYFLKIGRTGKCPVGRINKWKEQNGKDYIMLFSTYTPYNCLLERIIHLSLDFLRKDRIGSTSLETEWFNFYGNSDLIYHIGPFISIFSTLLDKRDKKSKNKENIDIITPKTPKKKKANY